jgi:hypothetical protein
MLGQNIGPSLEDKDATALRPINEQQMLGQR